MQYTDKLKLKKPEGNEWVNVADLNENMDALDGAVAEHGADMSRHTSAEEKAGWDSRANPNILINGDFQVWQRGAVFTYQDYNYSAYTADRWRLGGFYGTISKAENGLRMNGRGSLLYIFEDIDYKKIKGKTLTFSISINNVVDHFLCVNFGNQYSGAILSNGMVVNILPGNTINIGSEITDVDVIINWVKLEYGSTPTPFIPRLYAEELVLCQWYYETSIAILTSCDVDTIVNGRQFAVEKRIYPTIKLYNQYDAEGLSAFGGFEIPIFQPAKIVSTNKGISYVVVTEAVANSAYFYGYTVDAEIY